MTDHKILDATLIARVCHEANRGIQQLQYWDDNRVSPPWDQAPEDQRASAIAGVANALAGRTAAQLHDDWCNAKIADGWTFGWTKDPVAKTHPCLIPYDQLSEQDKIKDYVFLGIVRAFKDDRDTDAK